MPLREGGYEPMEDLPQDERMKSENRWQRHWYNHIAKLARGRTLLDVGAGTGYGLRILREKGVTAEGFDLVKLDPDVTIGKIEDYPDNSFDWVVAVDVIEHVEHDVEFLQDLLRVAREFVFIATPNWNVSEAKNVHHVREYNPAELAELLKDWKFSVCMSDANCVIHERHELDINEQLNNFGVLINIRESEEWKPPRLTVEAGGIEKPKRAETQKSVTIHQCVIDSDPSWEMWPHRNRGDFSHLMDKTWESRYIYKDTEIVVVNHLFPIVSSYDAIQFRALPPTHPHINNLVMEPEPVKARMREHLREFAKQCDAILWCHAYHCNDDVASTIPDLFGLRILSFGDDCPGSSDVKTFPICRHFNALYHSMYTWSFEGGEDVGKMYRDRGVAKTYFKSSTESAGLFERMKEIDFEFEDKVSKIERGELPPIDLAYVGHFAGHPQRTNLLQQAHSLTPADMTARFHGVQAPHGELGDRVRKEGCGYDLPPLYIDTLFGINPQMSSIFNTRLMDLWLMGVAQLIYDPHRELERNGFLPDVHYIPFSGNAEHLWTQIRYWKQRPAELAALIRRAHEHVTEYMQTHSVNATFARIYGEWLGL